MALKIPSRIANTLLLVPILFTIPPLAHNVEISNQIAGTANSGANFQDFKFNYTVNVLP